MKLIKILAGIIGAILFALLTVYLVDLNTSLIPLSKDGKFIAKHEVAIKKELFKQLDPEKKHIHSITIQASTARGKYDGGLGIKYYIRFRAFANDDKDYGITGEISFPNTEFGPFTFNPPDPHENVEIYMKEWYVEANRTDAPQWQWKIEEEKREYEEEMRKYEEEKGKSEESVREYDEHQKKIKEEANRKEPIVKEWVSIHETHLREAIYNMLLKGEPKVAKALGEIESVKMQKLLSMTDVNHGYELLLHLRFKNCPDEEVVFKPYIEFEDESFQDMSKGGDMHSGSVYYVINFEEGSKTHDLTNTIQIKIVQNHEIRID